MREKYWYMYADLLYQKFYLEKYKLNTYSWIRVFNIVAIMASCSSAAFWLMSDNFKYLYAVIVAVSQISVALKDLWPLSKRANSINNYLPDFQSIINRVEYTWNMIDDLDDQEINNRLYEFKQEINLLKQVKQFTEIELPTNKKCRVEAEKHRDNYLNTNF